MSRPADRRPRLRHRQPAVGREGPPARRRGGPPRHRPGRSRCGGCASCSPASAPSAPAPRALRESGLEEPARQASRPACRSSACASVSSSSTRGRSRARAARGLGVFAGTVGALPPGVKHPQMQWNRLGDGRRVGSTVPAAAWRGLGEQALGLLRPLLRPAGGGRDGRRVRLRRPGGRAGRPGHAVGRPVPPGEVRGDRPGAAGQLRGLGADDGSAARHRPARRRRPSA